jgi:hypothetical protein
MSAADNIYHRVFIFSQTQKDNIMEIEKSRGNVSPVFGKVIVRGTPKVYTDIINSRANIRYPDSRVLIEGDIRSIKYTETKIGR